MKNQKSEAKRAFLVLAGGSLMLLGCIIPDKSATAPSVAPGSAASIGGGGAAAPAGAAGGPGVAGGGGEGLRCRRADRRRRGREQPESAQRQPGRLLVHVQGQGDDDGR